MPRSLFAMLALAALAAACSGDDASEASATPASSSTAAATSTVLPAATPDVAVPPLVDPEAIAAWGERVCAALEGWTLAVEEATSGQRDPESLDLEARKQRSAAVSAIEVAASEEAAAFLREELPSFEVAEYHGAVLAQFEARAADVRALEQRLAAATSLAEFNAAEAEYLAAVEQRRRTVTAASQFLPPEAIAALTGGPCGYLTR